MSKFAMFFKRKSIGFYLMAAAFVFGVVGFVLFLLTMRAQENMMVWIVILSVAALAASAVVCALRDYLRLTGILCVALYLLCGLLFLATQAKTSAMRSRIPTSATASCRALSQALCSTCSRR